MITREQLERLWNYLVNDKIEEADRLFHQMLLEITQQEKVNELLDLYKKERSMLEKYINGNYQPMGEHANILKQIDELEAELNDKN